MSKKRFYAKKAKDNKLVAKERINVLFDEAKDAFNKDSSLSDRYVGLARRISMKYNVSIESRHKRMFCKKCHSFLMPGINCRIRVRKSNIVTHCYRCKNLNRFRYG